MGSGDPRPPDGEGENGRHGRQAVKVVSRNPPEFVPREQIRIAHLAIAHLIPTWKRSIISYPTGQGREVHQRCLESMCPNGTSRNWLSGLLAKECRVASRIETPNRRDEDAGHLANKITDSTLVRGS
uniref:Uncharacterized protein n=1 Tax=Bionectria ochroleuca TaxID=29856 RepID=A0A8H7TR50_BIOOC